MNFCPNCGSEKDVDIKICPYCGFSFNKLSEVESYEKKISDLEQKLAQVEGPKKLSLFDPRSSQMKYFWIMATIMVIVFFAFLFFFVFMASI
ncbi:MAG: hypothetical protein ACFFKA_02145 [Candidatus Thorarchaeota archaeon]